MEGHEITRLLERWGEEGDRQALDQLMPLVYDDLGRIAGSYLNAERGGHTLQATDLVHEAYLRLAEYREPKFENRKHFYAVAAQAVRRILVDHARRRGASKRNDSVLPPDSGLVLQPGIDVLALDEALSRLASNDPEKARIVELRYFAGLSVPAIAEMTGMSPATVKREWAIAKAWLFRALNGEAPE